MKDETQNLFTELGRPLSAFEDVKETYLIENLLCHPSLTLLYAPSGGQKSLLALSLAISLATGGKFLGYPCVKTPVIYVDGEMSDMSISKRVREMSATNIPEEDLRYITPRGETLDFVRERDQADFLSYIEATNYKFVVFDNLRVLLGIADENDSVCFYAFNAFVKKLRDLNVSVLVVHHSNKDGQNYAGSSNLITVYDYVIGLQGPASQASKKLHIDKIRDETELRSLDGQYVSYSPKGFKLNAHAGECIETAVADLVIAIKANTVSTSSEAQAFLRRKGIAINSTGWSYTTLFKDYIQPYYTGDDLTNIDALKKMVSKRTPALSSVNPY